MAEGTKVRLVRCPKCENLLPELPDFSLYQCGGCGAVLKAKHKGVLEDELPDISDDGTGQEIREESNVVEASEVKMANAENFEASILREARKEEVTGNGISSSLAESTEAKSDSGLIRRGKERIRNLESNRNLPINRGPNVFGSEYFHFPDEYVRGHRPPMEPLRPRPGLNKWACERSDSSQIRFVDSRYFDEGQSSYETELIRKLDELKDQISRSCNISDKSAYNFTENSKKQPLNIPNDVGPSYFSDSLKYSSCPYKPEILRGPSYEPHSQYVRPHPYHHHSPSCYYGDVKKNNLDHFMLNRREKNFLHQPACSCMHCYDKSSNLRAIKPRKLPFVNSNNVYFENDGLNLNYRHPRKFVAGHKSPVAGGAPFIGCSNCFEVLKIPRRRVLLGESKQKLICGACSSIIVFELGDKGEFIVSASSVHVDQVSTEMDECSSGTFDENARYSNGGFNSADLNTYSNEYENFQDRFSPVDNKSSFLLSEKLVDQLSSASSLSPDLDLPQDVQNMEVNCFDQRNKSQRPEQEKVTLERNASQQKSNEFSNGCVSHDSVKIVKEAEPKANKGRDSFFTGLIKKSFKDFKKPNQGMEAGVQQVYVNGHFIPERVVKRAEKSAGPIQPGEYWYDKRAGFWGVIGHPCLGIIMPNIEEFDYPMPDNCSAGSTGVFVNGRELHSKDLDLLASRGLPLTRNRSYLVEINGTVIDEQTGEELDGLGKLAPTVERAKHGFGMKVPRFIAQSNN
ncbi:hypothetical protein STAS_06221 [Striga asiatica]|uniref:Uncharacterized protein n=1 Tax=Striga asiatica TaxID=4170 RepID=A0A5A7PDD5_STRAF|nr:hypothetical protein STAS_06221 [Striga asiatica]